MTGPLKPAVPDQFERAIARFGDVRALVVGDFILDRFVHGVIERISPEAPIPVLHGRGESLALGGAGNVVANIVSLGATAVPVAVVGDDFAGRTVRSMLEADGIDAAGIEASVGRITSAKSRFSALNQQVLRFDEEEIRPLDASERTPMLERFVELLPTADIVILSDYGKGVLADGVAGELVRAARAAGKMVLVDPKGKDFSRYTGATAVTPNRKELGEAVGRVVSSDGEVTEAARELIAAHGFEFLLATRSEKGISVIETDTAHHIATRAREVFDVSGAGDTVIASFALALAAGLDRNGAAEVANAAAGVVVGKRGTARLSAAELLDALARSEGHPRLSASIVSAEAAAALASAWKREGLTVGFTNGCFDLLHAGHVALLQSARAACDRLVLGVNSDESVRRLKGEGRPLNGEQDRAFVLAALAAVDLVVIFPQDTPLELIRKIRPNVLVKGADYTIDQVVGAEDVQADGGRVLLVELVDGRSTTGMLRRIAERS
ncbi:MAG: D-glycero-beta-D-manno-heptose-7-phosphate kinase [Rhizobiaceae bacterium]|nr:D-glycero-beta-D-manno-heptose-7-phosphate kinase [Rhizobiaceae bacterium]